MYKERVNADVNNFVDLIFNYLIAVRIRKYLILLIGLI